MVHAEPRLILLLAGIMLLLHLFSSVYDPRSRAAHLMERGLLGLTLLVLWNGVTYPFGLRMGVNPLSALITGCLGLPGLALLTVTRLIR